MAYEGFPTGDSGFSMEEQAFVEAASADQSTEAPAEPTQVSPSAQGEVAEPNYGYRPAGSNTTYPSPAAYKY